MENSRDGNEQFVALNHLDNRFPLKPHLPDRRSAAAKG